MNLGLGVPKKKKYSTPQLRVYGALQKLTSSSGGSMGTSDGGSMTGMTKTGG